MKTGAIYMRVSTEDQAREGYSIDAQLKAIKEYAKRNDIIIDSKYIFKDEGISGRTAEKRPAFMEMIKAAKSKPKSPFNVILIHKFDRFARNRQDSVVFKALLKKECNVDVISITEDFGDDKFSIIIEAMLEAMAEYYSLNLSEEVSKGMKEKSTRGGIQSRPPFGYVAIDNKFIPNNNAKVVKMIYDDFLDGSTYKAIAIKLNKLGIRTINNNKFDNRNVDYILQNPVYKGYITFTEGTNKDKVKIHQRLTKAKIIKSDYIIPIIDEKTYDEAQVEILKVREKYKYLKPQTTPHWLRRLVRCSECGKTLTFSSGGMRCMGYASGTCDVSQYITIDRMEKLVLSDIKNIYKDNSINIKITKKSKNQKNNDIEIISERINEMGKMLLRAKDLYLQGIDNIEEYKSNKINFNKEISLLKDQLNLIPKVNNTKDEDIRIKAKDVYDMLLNPKIDMSVKYDFVHDLIDKIVYNKEKKELEIFYLN